jgi:hypothetical protein
MTTHTSSSLRTLAVIGVLAAIAACGKKDDGATQATAPAPSTDQPAGTAPPATDTTTAATTAPPAADAWTPEVLEQLLAPIAIYPDVVLGHVLTASTNPQEVLDAGNWLIAHQDLSGADVDKEAEKLGFSPSVRALLQFPETVDMMCMKMDWTTQLGQAFTADQAGVLDAVQRLRQQAKEVGNLQSSAQLAVATEKQDDKEIVTVKPADPKVVYVPKYDPVAVYAPPPANIPPPSTVPVATTTVTTPPGTTTTTTTTTTGAGNTTATSGTTTTEDKGHSTGALITTGLLAFGAGILVNEVFNDDDDWDDYYPNYYHGGMYYGSRPYYPPPPYMYRPPYGPGFYPSNGYVRPPNYQHGFNNNTIIVNNGGNNYWNRFNPGQQPVYKTRAQSPITAARPNRPELTGLNNQAQERARNVAARQPQNLGGATQANVKGQTGYAGARPENRDARERMVQNSPRPTDRVSPDRAAKLDDAGVARDLPKRPQGNYAGATNRPAARDTPKPATAKPPTREAPKRTNSNVDRGRPQTLDHTANRPELANVERPSTGNVTRPSAPDRSSNAGGATRDRSSFDSGARNRSAFEGGGHSAASERAASQRGRASIPQGARDARHHR